MNAIKNIVCALVLGLTVTGKVLESRQLLAGAGTSLQQKTLNVMFGNLKMKMTYYQLNEENLEKIRTKHNQASRAVTVSFEFANPTREFADKSTTIQADTLIEKLKKVIKSELSSTEAEKLAEILNEKHVVSVDVTLVLDINNKSLVSGKDMLMSLTVNTPISCTEDKLEDSDQKNHNMLLKVERRSTTGEDFHFFSNSWELMWFHEPEEKVNNQLVAMPECIRINAKYAREKNKDMIVSKDLFKNLLGVEFSDEDIKKIYQTMEEPQQTVLHLEDRVKIKLN